jgi:hypothetical protein
MHSNNNLSLLRLKNKNCHYYWKLYSLAFRLRHCFYTSFNVYKKLAVRVLESAALICHLSPTRST